MLYNMCGSVAVSHCELKHTQMSMPACTQTHTHTRAHTTDTIQFVSYPVERSKVREPCSEPWTVWCDRAIDYVQYRRVGWMCAGKEVPVENNRTKISLYC